MISKKRLRERVQDICNGAGYVWLEDDEYFEAKNNGTLGDAGNAVSAIERAFDIPTDNRLRAPWSWKEMESLDGFVALVYDALQYDI